jgi:hypothetical protein
LGRTTFHLGGGLGVILVSTIFRQLPEQNTVEATGFVDRSNGDTVPATVATASFLPIFAYG